MLLLLGTLILAAALVLPWISVTVRLAGSSLTVRAFLFTPGWGISSGGGPGIPPLVSLGGGYPAAAAVGAAMVLVGIAAAASGGRAAGVAGGLAASAFYTFVLVRLHQSVGAAPGLAAGLLRSVSRVTYPGPAAGLVGGIVLLVGGLLASRRPGPEAGVGERGGEGGEGEEEGKKGEGTSPGETEVSVREALDKLEKRYAAGEISKETYEELKRRLLEREGSGG